METKLTVKDRESGKTNIAFNYLKIVEIHSGTSFQVHPNEGIPYFIPLSAHLDIKLAMTADLAHIHDITWSLHWSRLWPLASERKVF